MAAVPVADVDDTVPAKIGCNGWNAEPNEGRNLKPIDGLNMADDGDKCSVSLDFKHTYGSMQRSMQNVRMESNFMQL